VCEQCVVFALLLVCGVRIDDSIDDVVVRSLDSKP
jgi:hypothetical protein